MILKKIAIAIGSLFVLLVVLLLLLPLFFKGDLLKLVQKESANYMSAELQIEDASISFFKNFPNINVALKNVSVIGNKEPFSGDTLASVPTFELSLNLKSFLFGKEMIVNKVLVRDAALRATIDTSGVANWNIALEDSSGSTTKEEESNGSLKLKDITIENLTVTYNDLKGSNLASIEDLNMSMSGDLSADHTMIQIQLNLGNIYYKSGNSTLINNCSFNWVSEITANLKEQSYNINKSDLSLNDLKLDLTGGVSIVEEEKYRVDLTLNAPDTKFESLLALVPKDFQKYIEGLTATGDFNLLVKAKGDYYTNHLPAIDAQFAVNNAKMKYSKLPESIDGINIDLSLTNPGGSIDSTVVDLKKMSFTVANNPFSMFAKVVNINDPMISGGANGVIDFESLKQSLPLENITLKGTLKTDLTFDGKYQYIEKEQYEKFTAKGTVALNNILIINKSYPKGIAVEKGLIVVTPAKLNLSDMKVKVNSSDFTLQGFISNYLPYLFKNEMLTGSFTMNSKLINLNEFMVATVVDSTKNTKEAVPTSVLEIPKNLDLKLNTTIGKLLFDDLTVENVKGNVAIAKNVLTLSNLSMNLLDGTMVASGKYSTVNPKVPTVDLNLAVSDFEINSMYQSFSMVKKSIPIAMSCQGKISSKLKFSAKLDDQMNPIMSSINGNGSFDSKGVLINNNPTMNKLAGLIKNEELSRLSISKLNIDFKIENGNITVEPFTTTMANNKVTIYGTQSVEGALNYTMSMNIKREYLGGDINKLLASVPGSNNIKDLDVDVKLGGTMEKPTFKPDLTKAIKAVSKEAEKELLNKAKGGLLKGLGDLFK